jgi:hypothetical protein
MTRRSRRLWQVLAVLFCLINLGGAGMAVAMGEASHALVHLVLLGLGAPVVWLLAPRGERQDAAGTLATEERLERLQQSLDAIAIEVERIGESQRFINKIERERVESRR